MSSCRGWSPVLSTCHWTHPSLFVLPSDFFYKTERYFCLRSFIFHHFPNKWTGHPEWIHEEERGVPLARVNWTAVSPRSVLMEGSLPWGTVAQCAPCTPALRELKRTESGSDATAVTDATKCCFVQLFQKTHSFWVSQRELSVSEMVLPWMFAKKKRKVSSRIWGRLDESYRTSEEHRWSQKPVLQSVNCVRETHFYHSSC